MKDNETFIREIYEKVKREEQKMKQKKASLYHKKQFLMSGTIVMAVFMVGIGILSMKQGQEERPLIAEVSITEDTKQEVRINDRRAIPKESGMTIEIQGVIQEVFIDGSVGTARVSVEQEALPFEKGESVQLTFDPTWLTISLEKGKKVLLTVEKMGDGTFVIVGGSDGIQ